MAGTPNYPRNLTDDVRDLRAARTDAQTAGQSRVAYARTSQGLTLDNLPADPPAPINGVILYAKSGSLWCRKPTGSPINLTP